jgi:hypothetical protein
MSSVTVRCLRSSGRLGGLSWLLSSRSGGGLRLGLGLSTSSGAGGFGLSVVGRGPESEVVAQKLHDEGAVAVGLLGETVKLGDGIVESLLGKMARAVG